MRIALVVLGILLLATLAYRIKVWNVQPQDRKTFINKCLNYGTEKFCNCFLDNLNQKLPAKAIAQLGTNYPKTRAMVQIEKNSVNACYKYNQ